MSISKRIDVMVPSRTETGQPMGWSPVYLDGFGDARHAAAEIASEGDALIAELLETLENLAVQRSGKVASTELADCMADVAAIAARKARAFGVRS